jgi:hypothetical protein
MVRPLRQSAATRHQVHSSRWNKHVICTAQTGSAVSFQVTVNNPGALSISLNGADTITVECGSDFTDPGATAINGSGQSVPVVVTLPQNFNPDSPAVGSYILTYTATEDPNSVSTTRTVNVSDTEAPPSPLMGRTLIEFNKVPVHHSSIPAPRLLMVVVVPNRSQARSLGPTD